jgi:ribonuclease HI
LLNILNAYPQMQEKSISRVQGEVVINKEISWDFSNGSNPFKGGLGGIIYLSLYHNISFKVGIDQETNKLCELMALKLVLKLEQEFDGTHLQFFGPSKLSIQWMHKEIALRNFTLQPLFDEVIYLVTYFSYTSMSHIYRDINNVANRLSKARVKLERGTWIISVIQNKHTTEYNHEPLT